MGKLVKQCSRKVRKDVDRVVDEKGSCGEE